MNNNKANIAFFGSSLVSAYWNGAATYYRGIIRALSEAGHEITFYEPDILGRQENRDIPDPDWCKVSVYEASLPALEECLEEAASADIIIKASGVGIFDSCLEKAIPQMKTSKNLVIFWDVDAPATLDRMDKDPYDPFLEEVGKYDLILTYGGGDPVTKAYEKKGGKKCIPIYNALDTHTHFPVSADPAFSADLAFLGNRLPDREARVEEFFLKTAEKLPELSFLLGGSGWQDKKMPRNVHYMGHVYTHHHNAFNCTPLAVLNISRNSMASYGFSPATRVFEAAGAGACIITDHWEGIDLFFEPGKEILVARDSEEVAGILRQLTREEAGRIGKAALKRVREQHTYRHRAQLLEEVLQGLREKPSAVFQNHLNQIS